MADPIFSSTITDVIVKASPVLASLLFGAVLTYFIFPKLKAKAELRQQEVHRKTEIVEAAVSLLPLLRGQIVSLHTLERQQQQQKQSYLELKVVGSASSESRPSKPGPISEAQKQLKRDAVKKRSATYEELKQKLSLVPLYFSTPTANAVARHLEYIEKRANTTYDNDLEIESWVGDEKTTIDLLISEKE